MATERATPHYIAEELDVKPWVELGLREIEEYLAKHAAFDLWLVKNGRT